ncbi:NAD-dependent epimerase/dehydratase family protein [Pseudochelatococcus contaminans]|uniref:UDP-glucuronate 4-epimerase n=1 Tax=Pseudochelatococcus contaminans TaxID=1538103 RepID=A0A7W6EH20_9HYPH|nr:NAD-dependent epimerase/dehydratase family protein [Pseudochelatococcus contaminans]MBB3809795.1 UDP-glucuronate 4-epimerase [Pseudochelatococcus contaminans]
MSNVPSDPAPTARSTSPVLVTGVAGFIGFHVARRLLERGDAVVGVDNFSSYYDPALKKARLAQLENHPRFQFRLTDLADADATAAVFREAAPRRVVHLAAQPGVRHSLTEPQPYAQTNVVAFLNVLEACRHGKVDHLVYASSSSVYGSNRKVPFSERDNVDHPVSLYAATKKANELMAHSYAHLYGLPATGLRFFTVYGPWGRPDMAVYIFTDAIARGLPINVSNGGRVWRDFTFIDDVVEGVVRILDRPAQPDPAWDALAPDPATSSAPHRIYNIGNNHPEELNGLIGMIEQAVGRTATRTDVPLPPGDVLETAADISDLARDTGFAPRTPLVDGVNRFVEWYRDFHGPDTGGKV